MDDVTCEARQCCWAEAEDEAIPWCFHASRSQAPAPQPASAPAPAGSDLSVPGVAVVTTSDELIKALQSNVTHVRITAHLNLTTQSGTQTYFALPNATLKSITVRIESSPAHCAEVGSVVLMSQAYLQLST